MQYTENHNEVIELVEQTIYDDCSALDIETTKHRSGSNIYLTCRDIPLRAIVHLPNNSHPTVSMITCPKIEVADIESCDMIAELLRVTAVVAKVTSIEYGSR